MDAFLNRVAFVPALIPGVADESGRYHGANGAYDAKSNTVMLDVNAGANNTTELTNVAMLRTMSHELTHAIQQNSPAQYDALKTAVLDVLTKDGADIDRLVQNKIDRDASLEGKYEAALDEVVADACENMLRDSGAMRTLISQHPAEAKTFIERVRSFFSNIVRAIRAAFGGSETAMSNEAHALMQQADKYKALCDQWSKALQDTAEISGRETQTGDGGVQLSMRTLNDGKQYTLIEVSELQDDSLKDSGTIGRKIRLYMREHFRGVVLPLGKTKRAYIRNDGINEYTNPAKHVDADMYSSKMLAATELDNLLKGSEYIRWKSDDGHHKEAVRGWTYWDTIFAVRNTETNEVNVYRGEVQIMRIARGDVFHDITKLKNITNGNIGQSIRMDAKSVGDNLSVTPSDDSVKFSMRESVEQTKEVSCKMK